MMIRALVHMTVVRGHTGMYWVSLALRAAFAIFLLKSAPTSWPRTDAIGVEVRYAVAAIFSWFVLRACLAYANARGSSFRFGDSDVEIRTVLWKRRFPYDGIAAHPGRDPLFGRLASSHDSTRFLTLRLPGGGLLLTANRRTPSGSTLADELAARGVRFDRPMPPLPDRTRTTVE